MPMFSFSTLAGGRDRSNKKRARKPTDAQRRSLNQKVEIDKAEEALDQQRRLRGQMAAASKEKKRGKKAI